MNLLKNCSDKKIYPWMHYIIHNYFDENTLTHLLKQIDEFSFNKSRDDFRDEVNLNYNLNDQTVKSILDSFLQKENIDFLSSIDNRIKTCDKLLRVSIWKDYNKFHLPIHTDSHYKLFTMQVYLPRNDEVGYGTTIYDQDGKFIKKTDYKLNDGYFFFPNINKIKTNHSFVEDIKSERCSIIFNIFDKAHYTKKIPNTINKKILESKKFLHCIEF